MNKLTIHSEGWKMMANFSALFFWSVECDAAAPTGFLRSWLPGWSSELRLYGIDILHGLKQGFKKKKKKGFFPKRTTK